MPDCRPENRPLFVGCPTHPEHADRKHDYMGNLSNYGDPCSFQLEPVTVADLLAAVRAGVESGTIKGEEQWLCREDDRVHDWAEGSPPHCWFLGEGKHNPECGPHVVIPVSDGGSET